MTDREPILLEITDPDGRRERRPLSGGQFVIGRSAGCNVRLADNTATVSRRHAQLSTDPFGRWWVRDLGSRNGTVLDGKAFRDERMLELGQPLHVGDWKLRLLREGTEETHDAEPDEAEELQTLAGEDWAEDAGPVSFSTLEGDVAPRVSAEALEALMALSERLLEAATVAERHALLGNFIVSDHLGATSMRLLKPPRGNDPPRVVHQAGATAGPYAHTSRGLVARVVAEGRPVLASNVPTRAADLALSLAAATAEVAAIACPVHAVDGSREIVYCTLPPSHGTAEWLALLAMTTRFYQQAEQTWHARRRDEANAAIERELQQAAQIQSRLIFKPRPLAGLEIGMGFKPSRWVGGDYLDVVPRDDGRVLLVVADVCGKGIQAAMVAGLLHSMVHGPAGRTGDLKNLAATINGYLEQHLPSWSFVTAAFVLLDPAGGRLEYLSAGHPPAMLVCDGLVRQIQGGENVPLGVIDGAFESTHAELPVGTCLSLYSDGITELKLDDGTMIEVEGWSRLLEQQRIDDDMPLEQAARELDAKLDEAAADRMQQDDRTFLLARRLA
ncbi:MAG: SpoIIE family protein phosphatase [Phycisphaerae bacterium]